jgi:hypothetical protein
MKATANWEVCEALELFDENRNARRPLIVRPRLFHRETRQYEVPACHQPVGT